MPRLKAVLFDLDGTLTKTAPISEIFTRILRNHGISILLNESREAFLEVMKEMSLESFKMPYMEFWRAYNLRVLERFGVKGNLEELADALTREWWENADLEVYPEVEDVLKMPKQRGVKIGIISNGFQNDIHEILSRTNLKGKFDVIVGVDNVGKPKPHGEIFRYALKKLKVNPGEVLFVGDDPEADWKGAEAAGLKVLLIDRNNKIRGEYRKIRNLREIINYL